MTQFRNWPATLAPASYRGAHFFVEHDEVETGRRLVVHQFPHKDEPYVEDLGRDANKISVTAYVVGDDADGQERSLRTACESKGPAMLVLPIDRMLAHCESAKRDFKKDKLGHVAFTLKFVKHGSAFGPFPVGWVASMLGTAAGAVLAPLAALFAATFSTVGAARSAADAAAGVVRDIGLTLAAVAQGLPMEAAAAPAVLRAAALVHADADVLASAGEAGHAWGDRSFVASGETIAAGPAIVARVAEAIDAMAAAAEPADLAREIDPLVDYAAPAAIAGQAPSYFREAANAEALATVVRVTALARWVEAVASRAYTDRRAAIQARADVAEAVDAELGRIAGPGAHGLAVALADLRGRAVDLITRRIADLAPILALEAPREMPSLWWANRLYGDASRAGEIARLNRVPHPSFLPRQIEALAR